MATNLLLRRLAPAAFLVAGACFATRNDVLILQRDIRESRAELTRQVQQLQQQQTQNAENLRLMILAYSDSLRKFEERFWSTGGDLTDSQKALARSLDTYLARLDAALDEMRRQSATIALIQERVDALTIAQATAAPATSNPDSVSRDSVPVGAVGGPVENLAAGKRQLDLGNFGTARGSFEAVLEIASDTALLSEAHYLIGMTYYAETNFAVADSVFLVVLQRYPRTAVEVKALYKHGVFLKDQRQFAEARGIFNRVVAEFPNSDEAPLARDRIAEIPPRPD